MHEIISLLGTGILPEICKHLLIVQKYGFKKPTDFMQSRMCQISMHADNKTRKNKQLFIWLPGIQYPSAQDVLSKYSEEFYSYIKTRQNFRTHKRVEFLLNSNNIFLNCFPIQFLVQSPRYHQDSSNICFKCALIKKL